MVNKDKEYTKQDNECWIYSKLALYFIIIEKSKVMNYLSF